MEGLARSNEAAAEAEDVDDLFVRLDACGQLLRIDANVTPTMFRCATVNEGELERLRTIEHVVRKGHVVNVGTGEICA